MQNDRDFVDVIVIYIQLVEASCHKSRRQYVIVFAVFSDLNQIYFRTICSLFVAPFNTAA